jgi:hypothetical protein
MNSKSNKSLKQNSEIKRIAHFIHKNFIALDEDPYFDGLNMSDDYECKKDKSLLSKSQKIYNLAKSYEKSIEFLKFIQILNLQKAREIIDHL